MNDDPLFIVAMIAALFVLVILLIGFRLIGP